MAEAGERVVCWACWLRCAAAACLLLSHWRCTPLQSCQQPPHPHHQPQGGDLRAALSGDRGEQLSWRRRGRQVALDIAAGLAHLHASNVMHRDLKSKNVLLGREWRAKLADVGTAALHSATFLSGALRMGWSSVQCSQWMKADPRLAVLSTKSSGRVAAVLCHHIS